MAGDNADDFAKAIMKDEEESGTDENSRAHSADRVKTLKSSKHAGDEDLLNNSDE